jgi:membrane protein implicated in regulation of membrane protease activity
MSPSLYWLIAAAILFALEAFGLPGIGFLFAAIGAFMTAGAIELGLIDPLNHVMQFALFFVITCATAIVLWKKLKAWHMNPADKAYSNIVGTQAIVVDTLSGDGGTVRWSGTLMQAKLQSGTVTTLQTGAKVTVTHVHGNVLTVVPKQE